MGRNHSGWELWLWNQSTGFVCNHIYYGKKKDDHAPSTYYLFLLEFDVFRSPLCLLFLTYTVERKLRPLANQANIKSSRCHCGSGLSVSHSFYIHVYFFPPVHSVSRMTWNSTPLRCSETSSMHSAPSSSPSLLFPMQETVLLLVRPQVSLSFCYCFHKPFKSTSLFY